MDTAITVVAIVVLAAIVQFLARKYSYLIKPPLRIHLVNEAVGKRLHKGYRRHKPDLIALGFTEIGTFRVEEMPGLMLTAFTQSFQAVCAVVYSHPIIGCFVDMFSANEEDLGLTVSNAPGGQMLDQPPGREKIIDKTLTVHAIHDRLLKNRPPGPYKRVDSRNFVQVFETEYAKEMDWRMKRGGVTEEEVRRTAQSMGITSDKTILEATATYRKQYTEKQSPR